ncbi:MAG: hypothetical protein IPP48_11160 [Chitinophagaceae bacterium]|nr:hypothetical protein [Chitinophagaceae bacterium]
MLVIEKIQPPLMVYWFAVVVIFILLGKYGRQAIEWVLMRLYDFFIQNTPTII